MDFIELGEEQAKVFAYWYFLLRQPEQAAQKAGVQDGVLLLGDRRVRRELRRLRREFAKQGAEELAKLGLYRILFAQAERDEEGNPVFDGFSAERFGTGKGMEYKAWDKLKACELLLRSGTATCVSDSSPGLVDMTDGATLANGGALKANHLYLATIEGRGVRASTAVTIMVRGEYTVS